MEPDLFGKNFYISLHHNNFPIEYSPCRTTSCFVCICRAGYADIEIDLKPICFAQNNIIEIFPGQILALNTKSDDFDVAYFTFSNELIDEILYRLSAEFIGFLKDNASYNLPAEESEEMITDYFVPINKIFKDTSNICRREMVFNLVNNFYLNLYNKVVLNKKLNTSTQRKRKKELQDEFFRLIKEHIRIREVSFFAENLCITPKYLSIVTKETTGSSAKDLIDKFAVTELKLRLKSTSAPLKTIAEQLNYPCEAFLCKFFKKHTGVTPTQYRNSNR